MTKWLAWVWHHTPYIMCEWAWRHARPVARFFAGCSAVTDPKRPHFGQRPGLRDASQYGRKNWQER